MKFQGISTPFDLLKLITVGSVDDGKSTLIGRLLYDSNYIYEDQKQEMESIKDLQGNDLPNLAFFTDGLRAEREQGITIDVAHRFFSTRKRKFILIDSPGHIQYTRNMITGASHADMALILIDARKGIVEQTRRHTFILSLLQIHSLVVCVNKMDMVDYSEDRFEQICDEFKQFISRLEIKNIMFFPISALYGDNIVHQSQNMPWYHGPTLFYHLENAYVGNELNMVDARFPVQRVIRPFNDSFHDYRGLSGMIFSGVFRVGDEIVVLPSGFVSKIKSLEVFEDEIEEAFSPMSITMKLEEQIDVSRGDMICKVNNQPQMGQDIEVILCWFISKPFNPEGLYTLMSTTSEAKCRVKKIHYKFDINTFHRIEGIFEIAFNDIGRVSLRISKPLIYDSYKKNKLTGSFILVDSSNQTVGAGMIL